MLGCCLGENLRGTRPDESLKADGGNAKWSLIGVPKKLGPQISACVVAEIPRVQAQLADFLGVAAEIHLREATTLQILKSKARHLPPRTLAQVFNGGILGMER
jgi:hypothetical protein